MILTVTINPLLERRYYFPRLDFSSVNRNGKLILKAGGKGINVSRQLNKLGVANLALFFAGGTNGKLFRDALRKEGINISDVKVKNETRDSAIIIDQSVKKVNSFFGSDPTVACDEVKNFLVKMEKAISTCEIVVFSGSSPCREADIIFSEGIKLANRFDKISICDTYGNHLQECLNASPTILHNNVDEIQNSLGIELNNENNFKRFLINLYEKGIKQAYITNAGEALYASNFDFHYKVIPPEITAIDSTGSGDAFVAGIVYGWHNKFGFEQQLRFASALGTLNAKSIEVCDVNIEAVQSFNEKIHIESLGKKLKNINDTRY